MTVRIEKELCDPVSVNGYCEVPGPLYHIYKVDEEGKKTFVKTVEKDIKEAAREAQRLIDIDVLEVAYKEKGPDAFSSVAPPPAFDMSKVKLVTIDDNTPVKMYGTDKKITRGEIRDMYTPTEEAMKRLEEIFLVDYADKLKEYNEKIFKNENANVHKD